MDRNNNTQSDGLLLRSSTLTTPSDFVLRWGNRKRLRCMKVQAKEGGTHGNENNTNAKSNDSRPIDRRAARSDLNKDSRSNTETNNGYGNGYINLRQRPASPSHRNLRNPDSSIGMRGHSNGAVRGLTSPERGNKKSGPAGHQNNTHHHHNKKSIHYSNDGGGSGDSGSSETTHEGRKGGSSPGGDTTITNVWPPKFVIALTNKEKEEDFLAIKGSKLPQRPKKRAKIIQRTVNLVCPGTWLCDLTLERYEVREKKVSKKRPRGLKAMGNMDSESSE